VDVLLAFALASAGQAERARALLVELLAAHPARHVAAYSVALVWCALGEHDRAFEWMGRAVEERDHWLVFLDVEPRFDPLRADPRFAALRASVGV
jgi:hypothetical protein